MWAEIFDYRIVGSFFLDSNLNGEMYLQLIENNIDLMLTRVFDSIEMKGFLGSGLWKETTLNDERVLPICRS